MDTNEIKGELIRIASVLVQGHYLPSDIVEDYHQKTYSRRRVASMMKKAHATSKDLAVQVRKLANAIPHNQAVELDRAIPCGPTCQRHVTHPCENCGRQWG